MSTLKAAALIRDIPDFPKPGIMFKDITPVLGDPAAMLEVVSALGDAAAQAGAEAVAGVEARGFIFGAPMALRLGVPFVPIRKPGKLPHTTVAEEYELEYGSSAVEVHTDAIRPGTKVVLVDDLLATGGTAAAAVRLLGRLGGVVSAALFVIELGFLNGRSALTGTEVRSLIRFD